MDFYKEGAKGRCATCGFLARHSSLDPSRYEEYSRETRILGDLWRIHSSDIATEPVCIRGELNIRDSIIKEAEAIPAELDDAWEVATLNILREDRDCLKWSVYQPSLTPAMHLQAYNQLRLEEERRDWEEQVEKERRTFETRTFRWTQLWAFLQVLVAVCAIVATVWLTRPQAQIPTNPAPINPSVTVVPLTPTSVPIATLTPVPSATVIPTISP